MVNRGGFEAVPPHDIGLEVRGGWWWDLPSFYHQNQVKTGWFQGQPSWCQNCGRGLIPPSGIKIGTKRGVKFGGEMSGGGQSSS